MSRLKNADGVLQKSLRWRIRCWCAQGSFRTVVHAPESTRWVRCWIAGIAPLHGTRFAADRPLEVRIIDQLGVELGPACEAAARQHLGWARLRHIAPKRRAGAPGKIG